MAPVRISAAVGLALVAAVITGCSGSGSHSGSGSTPSASAAGGGGKQANPAPTESNPPGDIPDNQVYVAYRPAA